MAGGLQKASIFVRAFPGGGVWVISVSFYTRKGYIHCMHDVEYTRDTGIHAYNTSTIPAKKIAINISILANHMYQIVQIVMK